MNFLQLCQATALDSGTVAGVPNFTTVAAATGRVAQVVGWVRDAYIDIQNERHDWRWMVASFTAPLIIGQQLYLQGNLGLTNVGTWLPDIPSAGRRNFSLYESGQQAREGEIQQIDYYQFRARYLRGVHDASQPTEWAISPRNELLFGPKPDKAYIVSGEYRITPQELALDGDMPLMPAQHHRVIVQEALRLMARSDEAFQVLGEKAQQYERLRNALVRDQTEMPSFGGGTFA